MGSALDKQIKKMNGAEPCDIDLDNKELKNKHIKKLSEVLKANRTCYALHLKSNWFDEEGVQHLTEALMMNRYLKRLYLGGS